ncbi:hypothetical protein L207DRAFT_533189 [Hyaloscypha variabilis F]|uniref:Uncharacterized protein n=1 Tax=Hyaloscypha variabilis (strain UAMH 11265 / GT02V1 / F) TaxID=1149755 RepID=A0A2J6RCT3_HYAVF|nr:hypothetical protein L207DRAFT_533189 [Hyaloscypha variabilis F]
MPKSANRFWLSWRRRRPREVMCRNSEFGKGFLGHSEGIRDAEVEIMDGESGNWLVELKKWGLFVDSVIYCFMLLWTSFELAGNSKGAEAAMKYTVSAYRIDI